MNKADCTDGVLHSPSGLSISSEALAEFPSLRHASTTRAFTIPGTSRIAEFFKIREHLDAPESFLAFGEQQHTSHIGVVSSEIVQANADTGYWRFSQTDAVVSPLKNVTVAIQTADCAPVFLFDPIKETIALAHAGWKGTLGRIVSKTVTKMMELGSEPRNIVAWVGPMAGGCCYEVSEELVERFKNEFVDLPDETIRRGRHLDLVDINCQQLARSGLRRGNIHRSNMCTIHNSATFYSYRADNGTNGRIISAMVMLGPE